jgi:hypothetical protein
MHVMVLWSLEELRVRNAAFVSVCGLFRILILLDIGYEMNRTKIRLWEMRNAYKSLFRKHQKKPLGSHRRR